MDALKKFNTWANAVICKVMLVAFTTMVIITFAQVVFRYVLEHPLAWSEELARYLFVWATFLGASVAFYERTHINVSLFTDMIKSPRAQVLLVLLADFCCMSFLAMYVYQGSILTSRVFGLGQVAASMEWLSIGVVYAAIPIGSLFMLLNVLAYTLRHLDDLRTGARAS